MKKLTRPLINGGLWLFLAYATEDVSRSSWLFILGSVFLVVVLWSLAWSLKYIFEHPGDSWHS